jgi:rhodanese-related sulfurtransferase
VAIFWPTEPPTDSAVDRLLAQARARLSRLAPDALEGISAAGGLIVDIRPQAQRDRDGELPGALIIERNVLEWRLEPSGDFRVPEVRDAAQVVVVFCDEGYASSLAAASLQDIGLVNATDLDGGYQAWLRFQKDRVAGAG